MQELKRFACAGTMESSDAMIELAPAEKGLTIEVKSVVERQFGPQIRALAEEVMRSEGVENAHLRIIDMGALECVLKARLVTAVQRGRCE